MSQSESVVLSATDMLVLLGHSIEEVKRGGIVVNGDSRQWAPMRLIQKMRMEGEKKYREASRNFNLSPDDPMAYIGGGCAIVTAAVQVFEELKVMGKPLSLLVFAAGRPFYLKDKRTPEALNEGIVMKTFFLRKAGVKEGDLPMLILAENKNTHDDIEKPLLLAVEKKLKSIAFLMLAMRISRARAFLDKIQQDHPETSHIEINFISAEDLLRRRYQQSPNVLEMLNRLLDIIEGSAAYQATELDERGGLEAFKKQSYRGTGNY